MSAFVLAEASGTAGYIVAAIALTAVALMLFFAEIFIPSFGLISLIALGCMAGSAALAFQAGSGVGYLFIVLNALAIPIVVVIAFKLLPRSPLVLSATFEDEKPRAPATESDEELVGREGVAETDLRPAGKARIDGRRVDVLTDGEYVDSGTRVKVVRVEGARVLVRVVKG
ncbi:unnamed protein product [marine sediment metagenome]|uniref:NfeD-like C-terminal domain-containing protein n=1 Tax=marine sediment metagenome TaxID=412755 RepID=X1JQ11_9ZZZZ